MFCYQFEHKAVAILLTQLYLGVRNIRMGPSPPAFLTPSVPDVLVKRSKFSPSPRRTRT